MKFWAQKIYISQEIQKKWEIVLKFEVKFGIPQAFGCIDGTHLPLKRPLINSQDFYEQFFFSLDVQAVYDNQDRFIGFERKLPGSVHDAKVFANSTVCKKLVRLIRLLSIYCLNMTHYLIASLEILLTHLLTIVWKNIKPA